MQAVLILQDGSIYRGQGFGAEGKAFGELVSYSCMMGYQEVMTDPAHYGKLVVLTYPMAVSYTHLNAVDYRALRAKAIYDEDVNLPMRKSHESPVVDKLYNEYFEKAGSHRAHEILHTHYVKRDKI